MLTLCGFAASNYYNKVKLVLLEKSVAFTEELVWLGQTDPACSPLGKVPYILTPEGALCESGVIMEYIEQQYPQNPLLPAAPFAAAKVRELVTFLELHLELVARKLYPQAFFGGQVSDNVKETTSALLQKNIAALAQLTSFSPFMYGDRLSLADCAAVVHLPLVSAATKVVFGRDFLAELPVRDYLKRLGERPSLQLVNAQRKSNAELMMARAHAKA